MTSDTRLRSIESSRGIVLAAMSSCLLPRLATYLGHVDIKSTQRYLHMTTDLLQEASRRFASYAQSENSL